MNQPPHSPSSSRRWMGLGLVAAAQFVVTMDSSIIGVALPRIQSSLNFSSSSLSWVFNAYVLAFGGLLLLGGRLSDRLGARRVFLAGWAVLAAGSVLGGSAWSPAAEICGRALQGGGAALIAPAALALLLAMFRESEDLDRAFTVYGAVAPVGGTAGVLIGGLLTEYVSWRWTFYLSVPFAAVVVGLSLLVLPRTPSRLGAIGTIGALTVTAGLVAIVFGLVEAPVTGWASWQCIGGLTAGAGLVAAFFGIQAHSREPLLRLGLLRTPALAPANAGQFLIGAAWIPTWFFLNLYLQEVLDASALQAGLALVPMIVLTAAAMVFLTPRLARHLSTPALVGVGFGLLALSMLWLALAGHQNAYLANVLPATLLAALGMAFAFIPTLAAAVRGAPGDEAGVASALVNTSYQVGSAVGLAVITAIATGAAGSTNYPTAFVAAAVIAAAGGPIALLLRSHGSERHGVAARQGVEAEEESSSSRALRS
jgi:EmrB/QacA subfamily drug resistance transporter